MTIGEHIKELRRKNDLTQEKLADFLCVSCQAVSKWECGVSSPDLSLIGPLTRLLHVSADELLGLSDSGADERRRGLEAAYEKSCTSGELQERYQLACTAVSEYPGDMKYLCWLADCEHFLAQEYKEDAEYRSWLERSARKYATVIESTEDKDLLRSAIAGIVMSLSLLNRQEEALKYAALYPEPMAGLDKREVMNWVLSGQEKEKNQQGLIDDRLSDLLRALSAKSGEYTGILDSRRAIRDILRIMIPDENYLVYHDFLFIGRIDEARALTGLGRCGEAVEALRAARFHAEQFDRMTAAQNRIHRYTAPLLNLNEVDADSLLRTDTGTRMDSFYSWLKCKWFEPLRGHSDFDALAEG